MTTRKLTPEQAAKRSNVTWYLPHHPVFNVNKPNKCRVVFDAAEKFNEQLFNEQLFQGPDLANSLTGVLIRFREEKVAFTVHLEAMFHQVKVLPKDADALRFLWWSGNLNNPLMSTKCSFTFLEQPHRLVAPTDQYDRQQTTTKIGLTRK